MQGKRLPSEGRQGGVGEGGRGSGTFLSKPTRQVQGFWGFLGSDCEARLQE